MAAAALLSLVPGAAANALQNPEPTLNLIVGKADTVTAKPYDIPAQPLMTALESFARQSLLRIHADSALVAGLRSHAVSGLWTAPAALRELLIGTGLSPHFADTRTAYLHKSGEPVAPQSLARVRIVARRPAGYSATHTSTATKTPTRLRDVPQSVTVMTRELMTDLAVRGMADVVRYVPGITMGQGEGNRDQPTIRGNATTADFFIDGVRDDVQYYRDVYNVERIEALKGANAMVFGRGGGGGVINRVLKSADGTAIRDLMISGGAHDERRAALDIGQGSSSAAVRLNGMYERSSSFRDGVTLRRYGINPTVSLSPAARTSVTLGYEYFSDQRTADRGVPSFRGRPIDTDASTFFGDPAASHADVRVSTAVSTIAHRFTPGLSLRNHSRLASYDKVYQNVFPGAVNVTGDQVSISAYNNATRRRNLFNQTDLVFTKAAGTVRHTLLVGMELGRQSSENYRATGYFNDAATSVSVPVAEPTIAIPVTFRQSATDGDNEVENASASFYVQEQLEFASRWQVIAGLRHERFDLRYHDRRTGGDLRRTDDMISPRLGIVFKPVSPLSLYSSYSVSHLPGSGDQFASLTDVTRALEPERFNNGEVGAKWELADRFALTAAAYRLDHTNTRARDPNDPARIVQTGRQRTTGVEFGASGQVVERWEIAGGFSRQRAVITSATAAAARGATAAMVPGTTVSLWNKVRISRPWALALGVIHQGEMYAAVDNSVTLPAYTRVDAATFVKLHEHVRAQLNVENLLDERYFATAHNNNNITPGSGRAVRLSLVTSF